MKVIRNAHLKWILGTLFLFFQPLASGMTLIPQTLTVGNHTVTLQVPVGTRVDFMESISGARFPTFGPNNEMLIGTNGSRVHRLRPPYTQANTLVSLSARSHSVVYREGKLYVAAANGLYVANYAGSSTTLSNSNFTRIFSFPTGGNHTSRSIVASPDGTLFVAIGIFTNCDNQYLAGTLPDYAPNDRRGGVWRIDETGSEPALIAHSSGLRNPIGIAFNPLDNSFWATNAGPDDLGNNLPREVFSKLTEGSWHGMPWFQYINGSFVRQSCIPSSVANPPRPASQATPPAITFDARSTPQGLTFVTGNTLGTMFTGNSLVAIHGSSSANRAPKIVMVKFSNGNPVSVQDVVTGFQYTGNSTRRFARPSGAIMGPDGHFYFTSDRGDVQGLFRLRRTTTTPPGPSQPNATVGPAVNFLLLDD